jgi:DNA polymerase-3 subunit delta'
MQFASVVGQQAVKDRLIAASREGRVSHALLFFGQPGSGVLPMARAFAQFLNCEQPGETDSCGVCGSCRRAAKMVHPDINYVYPVVTGIVKNPCSVDFIEDWRNLQLEQPYANLTDWIDYITSGDAKNRQGNIPAEEAQDIIHKINLKAFEGRFKVMIIWLPEKMHVVTANKLLKSLEEPPSDTLFILASEARDQLLSTILSRTQLVKLGRLQEEDIVAALQSSYNLLETEAWDMARLAEGDFNLAIQLARQERGTGSYEEAFLNWMRLCFNPFKTMDKLLAWVDGIAAESKEEQKQFLAASLQVLRECLLINVADGPLVKMTNAQRTVIQKFLPFVNELNAAPFMEAVSEAIYQLERNAHGKILFLDLSLKIHRILQIK